MKKKSEKKKTTQSHMETKANKSLNSKEKMGVGVLTIL